MTTQESASLFIKIIIRDLQLFALTAELPKAPKVCAELAELEESLKNEGEVSHAAH
jgi:hypothetical protein